MTYRRMSKAAGTALVAVLALSGCQDATTATKAADGASTAPASGAPAQASPSPSAPAGPVEVSVSPKDSAKNVRPAKGVTVTATGGRLTKVTVKAADGTKVAGELVDGGVSWRNTANLAASATYTVTAVAENADGVARTTKSSFRTVRAAGTATASIQPGDGWTVGVGMPVVVTFSSTVKNRAEVEKNLEVVTEPAVEGAWRWTGTRQVQWRPKDFWEPGTKVSVVTDLKGVEVSKGIFGTRKGTSDFEVGSAMVSTVDIAAHTMTVRKNGTVVKKIPITTGKPGFATRNGTKVIISRETTHQMDAATTGTDKNDPEYYNLLVHYAMRLTWSGEFIHAAPWSVGSQGRANVSHGCTGMSMENARWMFDHSKVGDVVVFKNGSRKLEDGNGYTGWNMSFDKWSTTDGA